MCGTENATFQAISTVMPQLLEMLIYSLVRGGGKRGHYWLEVGGVSSCCGVGH